MFCCKSTKFFFVRKLIQQQDYSLLLISVKQKRAADFSTTLLKTKKDRGLYGVAHDPYIYFNINLLACNGIAGKSSGRGAPTPNLNSVFSDYIIEKFVHRFFQKKYIFCTTIRVLFFCQ